ncbi:MAG: hypothetical protein P8P70_04645 [Sulfitobacter sp.]|nr:hypothetical protein [Sulfitobacter sp.]
MSFWSWLCGAICGLFTATTLYAGAITLLDVGSKPRSALIPVIAPAPEVRTTPLAPSSLFIGRTGSSLFPEIEKVEPVKATAGVSGMSSRAVLVIRDIIQ